MAFVESSYSIVLTSGGGTVNLPVSDPYEKYTITGSATLAASYVIQASGSPLTNTKYVFEYDATIVLNSNNLTIFGVALTAEQAGKSCTITSIYNGSSWDTQIDPDFENSDIIETFHIVDAAITNDKLATDSVTNNKILDATITLSKFAFGDPAVLYYNNAVGSPEHLLLGADELPIGTGTDITTINKSDLMSGEGLKEVYNIPVSFESGEQAPNDFYVPYKCDIKKVMISITKDIAGTDDATIDLNGVGLIGTIQSFTIPMSAVVGNTYITTINSSLTGSGTIDHYQLEATKTTAGGKVLVSFILQRTV